MSAPDLFPAAPPVVRDAAPLSAPPGVPDARARRRPRWPGAIALVCAVLTAVLVAIGISVASDGGFAPATVVAWAGVGVSILGILAGIVAAVGRFGRPAGVAGLVLCLIANPIVLTAVLEFAAGIA